MPPSAAVPPRSRGDNGVRFNSADEVDYEKKKSLLLSASEAASSRSTNNNADGYDHHYATIDDTATNGNSPQSNQTSTALNTSTGFNTASDNNLLLNSSTSPLLSPYGSLGGLGSMMGGGMMGMGYGGGAFDYGGSAPGYYGGFGGMNAMTTGGPLSSLNQTLFGIQNLILSLGQAVQIVGMNAEAIQHLISSAKSMLLQAMESWQNNHQVWQDYYKSQLELSSTTTSSTATSSGPTRDDSGEDENAKKLRRRRQAIRWAAVTAITYVGYRILKRLVSLLFASKQPQLVHGTSLATPALSPPLTQSYHEWTYASQPPPPPPPPYGGYYNPYSSYGSPPQPSPPYYSAPPPPSSYGPPYSSNPNPFVYSMPPPPPSSDAL